MAAFIASFGLVAVAEIGDKTQLLSFVLAARFPGQHGRIIFGILIATLLNHLLAAAVGGWVGHAMDPQLMRWILGPIFLGFAVWALIPDKLHEKDARLRGYGVVATTIVLFFLAEMGDKTQLATVALGARYTSTVAVTLGTTCGMLAANVPAVLIGGKLVERFPLARMRFVAAALFALFGILILLRVDIGIPGF